MRYERIRIGIVWTIVVALGAAFASQAAQVRGACGQVTAACRSAGFVQGGAKGGNGLQVDCVDPIMNGATPAQNAGKALPQVDSRIIAACKASNPEFGQRNGPTAAAGAPPPPAAAVVQRAPSQFSSSAKRPNIVFILTDDLAWNLVQYMPHVLKMQKDGVTFANYFVTDSLCCPSRSSIFTGRYPHDTGIFRNVGKEGGYIAFRDRGHEKETFSDTISAAGFRTAMLGKYLNGYLPAQHPPAPGWTSWAVAGNGYPEFNYALNQDGKVVRYGKQPTDYLTDVLSGLAARFIKGKPGTPFLIETASFAPHAPYTPAPRDADAFPGLTAPRTPAFNAAPDASAPKWLDAHRPLSDADIANIDKDFRKRAQSVLAVDKMIGELQDTVAAIGEQNNTYFVFSSDNGYHMGEYRFMPGKMTAYDSDIHVPLIITGPGVPAGLTVQEIAENIDLYPTFTELAGAGEIGNIDGRSLVALMRGQKVADWRTVALVEHHGPVTDASDPDLPAVRSGNPPTYEAIRTSKALYVEYVTGDKEYHDLATDPDELHNTFASLSSDDKASLHRALAAAVNCHDASACSAVVLPGRVAIRQ